MSKCFCHYFFDNLAVFICNRIENSLVQSIENIIKIIIEKSGTKQNEEKSQKFTRKNLFKHPRLLNEPYSNIY